MDISDPKKINRLALTVIVAALLVATLLARFSPQIAYEPTETLYTALTNQLIFMAVIAVFIERAVETYLIASGVHDDRVLDDLTNTEYRYVPVGPIALTAGVILSAAVAASGVRLLAPVLDGGDTTWVLTITDLILTTGLLAGGSTLLHSIIDLLPTFTGRVKNMINGVPQVSRAPRQKVTLPSSASLAQVRNEIAARSLTTTSVAQHSIKIERGPNASGTLILKNATTNLQFPVVWDRDNRISPAVLPRCSRTVMATKGRPGIHMPGATLHGMPNNNIFIHRGRGESWSDGCFILDDDDMAKLLAAIPETDAFNITVEVT